MIRNLEGTHKDFRTHSYLYFKMAEGKKWTPCLFSACALQKVTAMMMIELEPHFFVRVAILKYD